MARPTAEHVKTLIAEFEAAAAFPATRAEASIRLGWFLHRIGRSEDAIVRLNAAEGVERGRSESRLPARTAPRSRTRFVGPHEEALASYGRAMSILPGAQSARVAMMNAHLVHGNRPAAEAMAETLQQPAPRTTFDPWWLYWLGDYRWYPQAMAAARAMIPGAGALQSMTRRHHPLCHRDRRLAGPRRISRRPSSAPTPAPSWSTSASRHAPDVIVTGLTATDFVIQDNGVRQDVSAVSYGKVPIDVTVGLDVSTSVTGPLLDRSGAR